MVAKRTSTIAKSKHRIFVVEDHPIFCQGLVRLIKTERDLLFCGKAGSAEQAFKEMNRLKPDLALIDLGLPGKSGLDLIKRVRSVQLDVKLLVVSMYDEAIYAERVLRAGGDGYIMKEEDPSEIVHAIRDVLKGRIYVSEDFLATGSAKLLSAKKAGPLDKLTDSELQLLESLGEGRSNEELARHFRITTAEVDAQCIQLQKKLELQSINSLIRYAVCWVEDIAK